MKWIPASLACISMLLNSVPVWAQQVEPAAPPKKEIGLWVAKDIAPATKIRLEINSRNIPALDVSVQKVADPVKWFLQNTKDYPPAVITKPVNHWVTSMLKKGDKPTPYQVDRYYSREVNLPPLPPGVYKITASAEGESKWAVVNVTHLAVVAKRSNYKTLVWVTDALKGNVLKGVDVTKYEVYSKEKLKTVNTGADGVAIFKEPAESARIIVTRNKDRALIEFLGPWPGEKQKVHFQTDRPVYRPGQTMQYKAIVRDSKGPIWKAVPNEDVTVEVRDSRDEVLDRQQLKTNAMGSVSGSFEIASEAATGAYSLVLTRGPDKAYSTFTVAAYRKPEYKVEMQGAKKRYLAGEEVTFNLNSSYYFGAPLQQAEVHYVVRRSPIYYWGSSDYDERFYGGDGNLYARDEYGLNDVVAEDVAHTDEQGNAVIKIKTDPKLPDETYSISATVTDASRRQVEAASEVPVYAALIRLGLRSEMLYVPLGAVIPVDVAVKDLDNNPTSAKVDLTISHQVWNEKQKKWHKVTLAKSSVNVPTAGKALAKLPANAQGDLYIEASAKDKTGRIARARMTMWVADANSKGEKEDEDPTLKIRLDHKTYKPGDIVKANVTGTTKGSPILLIAEGEDVFDYEVVPSGSHTWNLKTNRTMPPNAFVSATQWVKGQMVSGNQIVPLPDDTRLINVEATPDKNVYRPGEMATYKIKTTNKKGIPVSAEVALSVVDAAIYAIRGDSTPDLVNFYWGTRSNRVVTIYSAPEEVSGGAFQRVNPAAPVRQRFEDTAYWNPTIETGMDGEATITFQMPDNLTSWKAMARGFTIDTSVGQGGYTVIANRPVMMRLSTPRQMVVGDELSIISSINNRTDISRSFTTLISPEGLALSGPNQQPITVGSNAEGHVEWMLRADKLPDSGSASILGTTEPVGEKNADLSDALKVGFPIIPKGVLQRYSEGGITSGHTDATFTLPDDRIEPATNVQVRVWAGLQPVVDNAANNVLNSYRYGPIVAADQLAVAAMKGMDNSDRVVREALAELSRTQGNGGWGWWEGGRADPVVTARVLEDLARAKKGNIDVYQSLFSSATYGGKALYAQSDLWERKALLAASLTLADMDGAPHLMEEVLRRGIKMSPYARLKLAEALAFSGDKKSAREVTDDALKDAEIGPSSALVPAGEGLGWDASDRQTTAQALVALRALDTNVSLQSKLASELAQPSKYAWRSCEDEAAIALALGDYLKDHRDSSKVGDMKVSVNGTNIDMKPSKLENSAVGKLPRSILQTSNRIVIDGTRGDAFYQIDSAAYRPQLDVVDSGISVLRRIEIMSNNGVWHESRQNEPVRAGDAIRCTVLVWGRGPSQPTRVSEPLPASFEYVQEEYGNDNARQQVRDGSVEHYVMTSSEPLHFTYYLRAESTGQVTALPATAELLRNPSVRGQSAAQSLQIVAK